MNIRVLGFAWDLSQGATLTDLRRVLDAESVKRTQKLATLLQSGESQDGWDGTVFALTTKGKYWAGVVLKVRDQKQFCKVTRESGGRLKLKADSLEAGSKIAEVNFFLVHSETGKGLYQYYHHSTWVDSFSHLCRRVFDADLERRQRVAYEEAISQGATKTEAARARRAITGKMFHEILVRREAFNALVDNLSSVSKVRISVRDDSVNVSALGTVRSAAKRAVFEFGYDRDTRWSDLKAGIKGLASTVAPRRMRVEGKTKDDRQEVINLMNNPDHFDEIPFDDATADLDIDLSNPAASLEESGMVKRLLEVAAKDRVSRLLSA